MTNETTGPLTRLALNSPILGSDPKSGTPHWATPENRSGLAEIMASFALASKLGLCPESPVSPRVSVRQQIISSKKWGMFQAFCVTCPISPDAGNAFLS